MQPPSQILAGRTPPRPIVLVTHEYFPFRGGVATYVQEIASAARHLGFAVEVWTVDYRRRLAATEDAAIVRTDSAQPFPVVRLSSNGRLTPGGLLSLAWGFFRHRRRLGRAPIVLMSVGAQMAFFLLGALGMLPARGTICFLYGSEILRFAGNPFWLWLARRFYARAAGFAVLTPPMETLARASRLLPPGARIFLAPGALPSSFTRHPPAAAPDPATACADGPWCVLTVARMHPRKGQLDVARALALLPVSQRERILYRMAGVGDEAYRREVAAACQAGGVRCEFLGAVDDAALGAVYAGATVYAQASRTLPRSVEGFGISFLEASFHGCPVAAYRSGGVESAVRDGETGFLVAEGDLAALAGAIGRLLEDAALRRRLGEAGRTFARGFSWDESARVLCEEAIASVGVPFNNGCRKE